MRYPFENDFDRTSLGVDQGSPFVGCMWWVLFDPETRSGWPFHLHDGGLGPGGRIVWRYVRGRDCLSSHSIDEYRSASMLRHQVRHQAKVVGGVTDGLAVDLGMHVWLPRLLAPQENVDQKRWTMLRAQQAQSVLASGPMRVASTTIVVGKLRNAQSVRLSPSLASA
jgi:hypothetical protein